MNIVIFIIDIIRILIDIFIIAGTLSIVVWKFYQIKGRILQMEREKCIYCKKVDLPLDKVIYDDWDRLCIYCVEEFEGVGVILSRKE